jgi:uncharacterized protein (TIGR02147 family)
MSIKQASSGTSPSAEKKTGELPSVFAYLDYRKYLADYSAARKMVQPHFSYRFLSEKVGIRSGGFFSWVLQGKRNISDRLLFDIARFFKMDRHETAYFKLLVSFNQASVHEERKEAFDRLLSMRRGCVRQIDEDQSEFYRKWYYPAVRELVAVTEITDDTVSDAALQLSPSIKPVELEKSLALLTRLGLIVKNNHGVYERTEAVISSKERVPLVMLHDFQVGCMDLARESIDRFEKSERELSTITMSIDSDAYLLIIERLALLRAEVMEIARAVKTPSRVMQLNLQIFPLSREQREEHHE